MESLVMSAMEAQVVSYDFIVAQPISDLTTNQYNAMLAGIVNGVIDQNDLTEIQSCIGDGETEAKAAFTAFEEFWHLNWVKGFEDLGAVVFDLIPLMKDCTHIQDDVLTLENWANVFLTPADLPDIIQHDVTHNILKLTRDLNQAKKEWAAEEYFNFGTTLGEMLVIATEPLPVAYATI